MSDGHHDAPAYCAMCDRPILTGPLCEACEEHSGDDEDYTDEHWGGMAWDERIEFVRLNLANGNLTDAIAFMMHDGDVRSDSVTLALLVAREEILIDPDITDDADHHIRTVIDRLIRLINHWETK